MPEYVYVASIATPSHALLQCTSTCDAVAPVALLDVGGGCGVGVGLGWGYGAAWGSKYIIVEPEFDSGQEKKPRWLEQLRQQLRISKFEHAHARS
jgi:hypothetical protein